MLKLMSSGTGLFDDVNTEQVENRDEIVRRAFINAVSWLKERYGPEVRDWKWGRVHTLTFRHRPFGIVDIPMLSNLFNYGPIPAPGGDRFTVNATWFVWDDPENPFIADAGTAQRIVIDLSDWDGAVAVNSTGQSEQLFHRHREDLIPLWQESKYHPLLFSRTAIEASASSTLRLVPANSPD
jgi:penicillin amidase